MPTYDYQCRACGHSFEAMQSMKDDPLSVCPECERPELRRIITGGSGVIFRGSGFYVNDSKKAGQAAASTASSGEGSSGKTADSGSSASGSGSASSGSGSSDGGPAKSA